MKKSILAAGFVAASFASLSANADLLTFDGSSLGLASYNFDTIEWQKTTATITQTDTGNAVFDTDFDLFSEIASSGALSFTNSGIAQVPSFDFDYSYTFTGVTQYLDIPLLPFDIIYAYLNAGSADITAAGTTVATLNVQSGVCSINVGISGVCDVTLDFVPEAGFFFKNGIDVTTLLDNGAVAEVSFVSTVQSPVGLSTTYAAAYATQEFTVEHDGNSLITVAEPGALALMGLGLLGLAGAARRKKQA